jgi:hypothetical protein
MLAALRFSCPLAFSMLIALAGSLSLPVAAQVPSMEFHGVPASGIGGTNGAFAAVHPGNSPAYGGVAFGCCASFFFPSSFSPMVPYPSFGSERRSRHGHHGHGHDGHAVVAEPVFIPYAVPYAVDSEEDPPEEADEPGGAALEAARTVRSDATTSRTGRRQTVMNGVPRSSEQEAGANDGADPGSDVGGGSEVEVAPANPPDPPEPVVAQPTTVLVFKDGHRSEVVNYAIVGDTLFDFSGERARKILIADLDVAATQKANDAASVEFKLPPETAN